MTTKELLESYDLYDVPEHEADKYLHHINEIAGDTTLTSTQTEKHLEFSRMCEVHQDPAYQAIQLASALRQLREATLAVQKLAEEYSQATDEQ